MKIIAAIFPWLLLSTVAIAQTAGWEFPTTSSVTLSSTDNNKVIAFDNVPGATLTVNLPCPAVVGAGWQVGLSSGGGHGAFVNAPNCSGQTYVLAGQKSFTSYSILSNTNYEYSVVQSDGTNFRLTQSTAKTTQANGVVSSGPGLWTFLFTTNYASTVADNGSVLNNTFSGGATGISLPSTGLIPNGWSISVYADNGNALTISPNVSSGGTLVAPGGTAVNSYTLQPGGNFVKISFDGSSFRLTSQPTIVAAAHVGTEALLATHAIGDFPNGVWRDDYSSGLGAPPLWYVISNSPCSLNAGAGDGGSQVPSSDNKCFIARFPASGADVREWGAFCNNSANDTAAINSAFASGIITFLFPPNPCRVTTLNSPPVNSVLRGQTEQESLITTTSAAGDVLPLNNGGVHIDRVGFTSSVTRTGGCYIHLSASGILIQNFFMSNAFCAFKVDDATSSNFIDYGNITSSVAGSQDLISFGSGTSSGAVAQYFGHTIINSGTPPINNIAVLNVGDLTIDSIQSIGAAGANLSVKPSSGQSVLSLKVINSFFDAGGTGMSIGPTGTGIVARSQFVNSWFGDGTVNGAVLDGGTGSALVDGMQFTNCQFVNVPTGSGLVIQNRVEHTTITDSLFAGNTDGIFDNRSAATPGLYISNSVIGQGGGFSGNSSLGFSGNGGGDYLVLMNNWLGANGAPYSSSNVGTHNVVENNAGYNPIGRSVPSVGASPWTFTNGSTHATYYSFGGTISSITVNGNILFNTACSPCVIPLAPNDVVVTTYSGAPTVNVLTQ